MLGTLCIWPRLPCWGRYARTPSGPPADAAARDLVGAREYVRGSDESQTSHFEALLRHDLIRSGRYALAVAATPDMYFAFVNSKRMLSQAGFAGGCILFGAGKGVGVVVTA